MELNCEYASGKGGNGELHCCGIAVMSSCWLLNCELWPYSSPSPPYFSKIPTLVAGKVHSLLITFFFIYYSLK